MNTSCAGVLEIDHERGVIWFNSEQGQCILRICRLGQIPEDNGIDITINVPLSDGKIKTLIAFTPLI